MISQIILTERAMHEFYRRGLRPDASPREADLYLKNAAKHAELLIKQLEKLDKRREKGVKQVR